MSALAIARGSELSHLTRAQAVKLLEELDTLREENRQLKETLAPPILMPRAWRMTSGEGRFLSAIRALGGAVLHRERAMIALYGMVEDWPEEKILDVWLCKVRHKLMLAQARVEVETVWGRGWRMSAESIARFDEAVRVANAFQPWSPRLAAAE